MLSAGVDGVGVVVLGALQTKRHPRLGGSRGHSLSHRAGDSSAWPLPVAAAWPKWYESTLSTLQRHDRDMRRRERPFSICLCSANWLVALHCDASTLSPFPLHFSTICIYSPPLSSSPFFPARRSLRPVTPAMGKCGICDYVSPPDGPRHDARTCPLKNVECRKSLPDGHPFSMPGHCLQESCVYTHHCDTCGLKGHSRGTLKLNPSRFRFNDKGIFVRRQNKAPLGPEDFVCTLLSQSANLVSNTQNASAAKAVDAHQRRVSTFRLLDNVHAAGMDLSEAIRLVEHKGTKSALLNSKNKKAFLTLTKNAHLGAVEATRLAAEEAESSLGEEGLSSSEDENERSPEKRPDGGRPGAQSRAVRRFEKSRKSRMDRYALAVYRGRTGKATQVLGTGKSALPRRTKNRMSSNGSEGESSSPDNTEAALGSRAFDAEGDVAWPRGTRAAFENDLPVFFSPSFAACTPLQVAHAAMERMCQCPIGDVEKVLSGLVVKGAMERHVRGYILTSGSLNAAVVAEWLCSSIPDAMRAGSLTSMARAVAAVVDEAATKAATSVGLKTPVERVEL